MGLMYSAYIKSPETHPNINAAPTFEPLEGFENGRKERVMQASKEDMERAGLDPEHRDYCAHILLDFYKCRDAKWPWVAGCKDELHHWEKCEYDDYVLRMKEYEREKRLLERRKRIAAKQEIEDM